ncbi:hypothetical protein D3C81_2143000 [compost metagenome]
MAAGQRRGYGKAQADFIDSNLFIRCAWGGYPGGSILYSLCAAERESLSGTGFNYFSGRRSDSCLFNYREYLFTADLEKARD